MGLPGRQGPLEFTRIYLGKAEHRRHRTEPGPYQRIVGLRQELGDVIVNYSVLKGGVLGNSSLVDQGKRYPTHSVCYRWARRTGECFL